MSFLVREAPGRRGRGLLLEQFRDAHLLERFANDIGGLLAEGLELVEQRQAVLGLVVGVVLLDRLGIGYRRGGGSPRLFPFLRPPAFPPHPCGCGGGRARGPPCAPWSRAI